MSKIPPEIAHLFVSFHGHTMNVSVRQGDKVLVKLVRLHVLPDVDERQLGGFLACVADQAARSLHAARVRQGGAVAGEAVPDLPLVFDQRSRARYGAPVKD